MFYGYIHVFIASCLIFLSIIPIFLHRWRKGYIGNTLIYVIICYLSSALIFCYGEAKAIADTYSGNTAIWILESLLRGLTDTFKSSIAVVDKDLFLTISSIEWVRICYEVMIYFLAVCTFLFLSFTIVRLVMKVLRAKISNTFWYGIKHHRYVIFTDYAASELISLIDGLKKGHNDVIVVISRTSQLTQEGTELASMLKASKVDVRTENFNSKYIHHFFPKYGKLTIYSLFYNDIDNLQFAEATLKILQNHPEMKKRVNQYSIFVSYQDIQFESKFNYEKSSNGIIRFFNEYNWAAIGFAFDNPITKLIDYDPKDFKEGLSPSKNLDINVNMFGFGAINQAILDRIVSTYQLDDENNLITYHAIDQNAEEVVKHYYNNYLAEILINHKGEYLADSSEKSEAEKERITRQEKDKYLDIPEIMKLHKHTADLNNDGDLIDYVRNEIIAKFSGENPQQNFINIIAAGTSVRNAEVALKLHDLLKKLFEKEGIDIPSKLKSGFIPIFVYIKEEDFFVDSTTDDQQTIYESIDEFLLDKVGAFDPFPIIVFGRKGYIFNQTVSEETGIINIAKIVGRAYWDQRNRVDDHSKSDKEKLGKDYFFSGSDMVEERKHFESLLTLDKLYDYIHKMCGSFDTYLLKEDGLDLDAEWYKSDYRTRASNFSSSIGMKTKLQILGYDLLPYDTLLREFQEEKTPRSIRFMNDFNHYLQSNPSSKKSKQLIAQAMDEYNLRGCRDIYTSLIHTDEAKKEEVSLCKARIDSLAKIEHNRWSAFCISRGDIPYEKKYFSFGSPLVPFSGLQPIFKNGEKTIHACLTTNGQRGLKAFAVNELMNINEKYKQLTDHDKWEDFSTPLGQKYLAESKRIISTIWNFDLSNVLALRYILQGSGFVLIPILRERMAKNEQLSDSLLRDGLALFGGEKESILNFDNDDIDYDPGTTDKKGKSLSKGQIESGLAKAHKSPYAVLQDAGNNFTALYRDGTLIAYISSFYLTRSAYSRLICLKEGDKKIRLAPSGKDILSVDYERKKCYHLYVVDARVKDVNDHVASQILMYQLIKDERYVAKKKPIVLTMTMNIKDDSRKAVALDCFKHVQPASFLNHHFLFGHLLSFDLRMAEIRKNK